MAKPIDTLVQDIYTLLGSDKVVSDGDVKGLSHAMAGHITNALKKREPAGGLRASQLGIKCDRKTWYLERKPELAEDVEPWTKLKFLIGHLWEEVVLFLAEQAGRDVKYRQETIIVDGVPGHPDAVIDGVIVDVKSANSRGMDKFRKNKLISDDPFGYMDQLDFYRTGMVHLPEVTDKNTVAFLACDKELGHIVLDKYVRDDQDILSLHDRIEHKKRIIQSDVEPLRGYMAEPDGKSGNMKLPMECRYCEFKHTCWPGLRTFLYSNGPRFLTKVVKLPDVPEVRKK